MRKWALGLVALALVCAFAVDGTSGNSVALAVEGISKIAFVSNRDGNCEIYVMNPDGSKQTRLTYNDADDREPAWSPDGRKIAFASNRDGNWEIYVMNPDGSNPARLTYDESYDREPSWSPDGERFAFVSDRSTEFPTWHVSYGLLEIYTMDADGSNQAELPINKDWPADLPHEQRYPSWSPDGTMIAFTEVLPVWCPCSAVTLVPATGGDLTRITTDTWGWKWDSSWSPDGSKIAYTYDEIDRTRIEVIPSTGGNAIQLTDFAPGTKEDWDPSWSPGGSKIVFSSMNANLDWKHDIWIIPSTGGEAIQITDDPAHDFEPSWSPFLDVWQELASFAVEDMRIHFHPLWREDSIRGEGSFELQEGATYDLSQDVVQMDIDGITFDVPPGGFRKVGRGERYIYRSQSSHRRTLRITMMLDFDEGTWSFDCSRLDASDVDNSDGVDVTLLIGTNIASLNLVMEERRNRLDYKYRPNRNCKIVDGIRFCIRADKGTYVLGEPVSILYSVTNLVGEEQRFVWFYPVMDIMVSLKGRPHSRLWRWGWDKIFHAGPTIFRLPAYGTRQIEAVWPQVDLHETVDVDDDTPAGPGRYVISGHFYGGWSETQVSIDIRMVP